MLPADRLEHAGLALGRLWMELVSAEEHEERAIAEATDEVRRFRAEFGHATGEECSP